MDKLCGSYNYQSDCELLNQNYCSHTFKRENMRLAPLLLDDAGRQEAKHPKGRKSGGNVCKHLLRTFEWQIQGQPQGHDIRCAFSEVVERSPQIRNVLLG